ncbi:NnrU family protein [Chromatium okenii]|uniref:NnrU family protein n=1 Tax=Chromatium okenii TaxID=61644 RepID=UPI0026EE6176|nr:NnrU family protein [Chromatium okenii]MBV5309546.1 NnrU family protein [Chromatium okenii]
MTLLILGLLLFLGTHAMPMIAPNVRPAVVANIGIMGWQAIYSLLALIGFVLIVFGYSAAHPTALVLYNSPLWFKHLDLLLMLPVFPLLFAAYLPGRIQQITKHPMLLAVKIWAFAHLLVNGALTDLLLFGGFLIWAVAARISLKHRSGVPVQGAPAHSANDAIAVIGGLVVYLLFLFWLHRALIGVSPFG